MAAKEIIKKSFLCQSFYFTDDDFFVTNLILLVNTVKQNDLTTEDQLMSNIQELDELDETQLIDPSTTGSLCICAVLDTHTCRTLAWLSEIKYNSRLTIYACTKLGSITLLNSVCCLVECIQIQRNRFPSNFVVVVLCACVVCERI